MADLKLKISTNKNRFTSKEVEKIDSSLKSAIEAKNQYLLKLEAEKKWAIKQKKIKQDVINTLSEKFKKEGYNSEDLVERGLAYKFLEMYEKALTDFNHAIKLNAKNRTAWVQRAHVLTKLKQYTKAIDAYKDLINKYPDAEKLFRMKIDEIEKKQRK